MSHRAKKDAPYLNARQCCWDLLLGDAVFTQNPVKWRRWVGLGTCSMPAGEKGLAICGSGTDVLEDWAALDDREGPPHAHRHGLFRESKRPSAVFGADLTASLRPSQLLVATPHRTVEHFGN
jgi:hypothetical protein